MGRTLNTHGIGEKIIEYFGGKTRRLDTAQKTYAYMWG